MRVRRRFLLVVLTLASSLPFLSCSRREPPLQDLAAGDTTRKAQIFLISLAEGAVPGAEAGCDGDVTAVEVELPAPSPALKGSLEALLAAGDGYTSGGFYNALAHSPLRLERVERTGGEARVHLAGYLELAGECDGPRALSQLTETASQFRDIDAAEFFLGGQPLRELLATSP